MKKIIKRAVKTFGCILLAMAIALTGIPIPVFQPTVAVAQAASPVVEKAISWAVSIANDNSHGYSQSSRWGPDYDCSSLVISAFKNAGVNVGAATYTGNMRAQFTQHGFQWIPWSQIGGVVNLQRGDILLNEKEHTELYLGGNQNVGAHSHRGYPQTGDQTGTEISVSGYYNHPWDGVLRYAGNNVCTCSVDYAGDYYVTTDSLPLTMRSGHGTGYSAITSIPKGTRVYVSRADGSWAHVEWNGYNGYCSMGYLAKMASKNYTLHVWVSETGMGGVPSDFACGKRYYICYELIDTSTGKRANETSSMGYNVTETVRNSKGKVFEHTYQNSDNNWIYLVCDSEDTYTGTVTVSGDVNVSSSVSFEVYENTAPQIKVWAWKNNDSQEISTIDVGKAAYCSYLIKDKNTGKNLNDVTAFWTKDNGYTITVEVYNPTGSLIKNQSYQNNDCTWFSFVPDKIGDYKIKASVTGNLSGSYERTIRAEEREHQYSSWGVTKKADCTQTGIRTRTCTICNKTQTETIPASGHTIVKDKMVAATCAEEGWTEGEHCLVCGKIIVQQKVIPVTKHNYNSDWQSDGNTHWRECKCGKKGEITSHMFKWVTDKPATSLAAGLKHEVCSVCGFGRNYNTIIDKIESGQPVSPAPAVKFTNSPTTKPTVVPESTAKPTVTPVSIVKPQVTPAFTAEPTVAPASTVRPVVAPTSAVKPTVAPVSAVSTIDIGQESTVRPTITPLFTAEPAVMPTSTTKPLSTPTVSPNAIPTKVPEDAQIIPPTPQISARPTEAPEVSSKPANKPSVNDSQDTDTIGRVKIVFSIKKKGKVYLFWGYTEGASGYQIQYSLGKSFSKRRLKNTKKESITLKGLKSKKKYYIRIRAYSGIGNRQYGKWSKVHVAKVK